MDNKKYILFGAGDVGKSVARLIGRERVLCFCDNSMHRQDDTIDGVKIVSVNELPKIIDENVEVLITTIKPRNIVEISKQLHERGFSYSYFEDACRDALYDELRLYEGLNRREAFNYDKKWEYLVAIDRYKKAGSVHSYFWQDLWAAKRILTNKVDVHYDIGSRLDGFIAHLLSAGQKVRMIDIRPLLVEIDDLEFEKADATELESIEDNSMNSLSALCSLEHFGLGRYGDSIDPEACFKSFKVIQQKLSLGGHFYLSVPIGMEHLEFNAHRVFSPYTIVNEFSEMNLIEFSSCYKEEYEENIQLDKYVNWDKYGGDRFGLFHFVKI